VEVGAHVTEFGTAPLEFDSEDELDKILNSTQAPGRVVLCRPKSPTFPCFDGFCGTGSAGSACK